MTSAAMLAGLRDELANAVHETDLDRTLDSLESTVVLAVLTARGVDVPDGPLDEAERPTSIREWLAWAERRSSTS